MRYHRVELLDRKVGKYASWTRLVSESATPATIDDAFTRLAAGHGQDQDGMAHPSRLAALRCSFLGI
jgi:hypothetical protein